MRAVRDLLTSRASNWAVCLLSASFLIMAASNWTRPASVSAQGPGEARTQMSGESRAVLTALQDAFVNIAENVEPSVVTIAARNTPNAAPRPMQDAPEGPDLPDLPGPFQDFFRGLPRPDGPRGGGQSTGSGVIIRESGSTVYVLTNNHVLEGKDRFRVQLQDRSDYAAELVGRDERTDLAVVKFQTRRPLPARSVAKFGDSDRVKVGQWAIAIGSPLGYESSLTVGVISALGRELSSIGRSAANYVDLIQTDASINRGNSGGPLVNINGEVVGVNVAIASDGMSQGNIGIGFAIPVNTAKMVAEQLIEKGKVTRGFLGVAVSPVNRELSPELREHLVCPDGGALIESVSPNTPASRGGLKEGDVVVRFDSRPVCSFTDLEKAVAVVKPGSTVPVDVVRDGKAVRLNITVIERPEEPTLLREGGPEPPRPAQPTVQPVRSKFGLSVVPVEGGKGVRIHGTTRGSAASEAGLRQGDVIRKVGDTETPTVEAFQKAVDAIPANGSAVLRVETPAGLRFVVLRS